LTNVQQLRVIHALYGLWLADQLLPRRRQRRAAPTAAQRHAVTRTRTTLRKLLRVRTLPTDVRAILAGAERTCRRWLERSDWWRAERRAHRMPRGRPAGLRNATLYACVLAEAGVPLGAIAKFAVKFAPGEFPPDVDTIQDRLGVRISTWRQRESVREYLRRLNLALTSA
jgi:hypothetical protein